MEIVLLDRKYEPVVSLEELKWHLKIDSNDEDDLLSSLLETATEFVENYVSRSIVKKTWELTHKNNKIYLPNPPVAKIIKVKRKGMELKFSENEPGYSEYTHIRSNGMIVGVRAANTLKDDKITVVYDGGYEFVPKPLVMSIIEATKSLYTEKMGELENNIKCLVRPYLMYRLA